MPAPPPVKELLYVILAVSRYLFICHSQLALLLVHLSQVSATPRRGQAATTPTQSRTRGMKTDATAVRALKTSRKGWPSSKHAVAHDSPRTETPTTSPTIDVEVVKGVSINPTSSADKHKTYRGEYDRRPFAASTSPRIQVTPTVPVLTTPTSALAFAPTTTSSSTSLPTSTETPIAMPPVLAQSATSTNRIPRVAMISVTMLVPALCALIILLACLWRRRRTRAGDMAEKPHDPPDGKAAPEANDSQLNMIEVLPFRSYEPRRVSKLGFKQFASSVEGGFQSISSSLSSFGSSLKGQMTRSDSYESQLPDILKSPQCPLASLSPDLLETPGREWESDLMVEDYILDVCDSQHIPYAEVRQLELAEEQDPFADAWEPRSHRSDSHENGSHGQVANVDQNEVNILQIPRSVTVPVKDMHRTSKASLLYHDSGRVPSPPQALVHQPRSWESDNTTSSEDPLISGNSREGRIKSTGLPDQDYFSFQPLPPGSLNALHCSGTRPIVISSSHKRIPISTWVFRSMRQPSKSRRKPRKVDGQENQFDHRDEEPTGLYRYPSTSTTCTKFTVASASSGSSAASLYLCHRCSLSGGGTTWSKKSASSKCGGHCKACGFPFPMSRSPPSRRSESSSASNQSEDSLSRFL